MTDEPTPEREAQLQEAWRAVMALQTEVLVGPSNRSRGEAVRAALTQGHSDTLIASAAVVAWRVEKATAAVEATAGIRPKFPREAITKACSGVDAAILEDCLRICETFVDDIDEDAFGRLTRSKEVMYESLMLLTVFGLITASMAVQFRSDVKSKQHLIQLEAMDFEKRFLGLSD